MKAQELREKSPDELKEVLADLRKQEFELRMKKGAGQLSQTHLFRQLRRDIARVKTVLRSAGSTQA